MPALALTCLIETIVYLAAFAALGLHGRRAEICARRRLTWPRAVLLVLAVNLVSHPLLWWLASSFDAVRVLLLAEIGVVAVEGTLLVLVLRGQSPPLRAAWAYGAALLANAVSFLAGLLWSVAALSAVGSAVCC